LPGFGYAKTDKSTIRQWKILIERYFQNRSTIALAIQLIDSRMPPTKLDVQLSEWLDELEIPRLIVGTKSDKLSNNQKGSQLRVISNSLGLHSIIMSSAETGMGCKEIWKQVLEATAVVKSSNE
jgi:GTP-binding protein